MTATIEYLFRAGSSVLFTGFYLWIILFAVAAFRDPNRGEMVAWSINTQWAAAARILRHAAGFRIWGTLAKGVMALGVTFLVLAGALSVVRLIFAGAGG